MILANSILGLCQGLEPGQRISFKFSSEFDCKFVYDRTMEMLNERIHELRKNNHDDFHIWKQGTLICACKPDLGKIEVIIANSDNSGKRFIVSGYKDLGVGFEVIGRSNIKIERFIENIGAKSDT